MIGSILAKSRIRSAIEALNQRDLDQFMAGWHDEGQFIFPGSLPVSGTFVGKPAVHDWFQTFFEQFPHLHFTINHIFVDRLFDWTGTNTLTAQWDIEMVNKHGDAVKNVGINVIKVRQRRVVEVRDFFFFPERLPIGWAGVEPRIQPTF